MPRRWPATALILILAACTGVPASLPTPPSPTTAPASTSTTTIPTTSTSTAATTTTPDRVSTTQLNEVDAVILDPPGAGPHPAAVLVHGGSWVAGSPASLQDLADQLATAGYLVFNIRYRLATLRRPGFPDALNDVACAVRHAATHPESDGSVVLVGHSAGAHLAAVVALTGDKYGAACSATEPARAERLIGLAGPYDITRVGLLARPFFGVRLPDDPATWAEGNPIELVDADSGISALLVHGEADAIVGIDFAEAFAGALEEAGLSVVLERVPEATHMDITDPEIVGEIVLAWLGAG